MSAAGDQMVAENIGRERDRDGADFKQRAVQGDQVIIVAEAVEAGFPIGGPHIALWRADHFEIVEKREKYIEIIGRIAEIVGEGRRIIIEAGEVEATILLEFVRFQEAPLAAVEAADRIALRWRAEQFAAARIWRRLFCLSSKIA